jgi:predicted N-acetyltransferase YhbS
MSVLERSFQKIVGSNPDDIGVREIHDRRHRDALSSLLDRSFGLSADQHFLNDFPVWDPIYGARVIRLGLFDHEEIVATAGLRLCEWKLAGGERLPVGIIGGVATDARFRGQKIASRLTERLCEIAEQKGLAAVLLWGSQHGLYRRVGFELEGTQIRVALGQLQPEAEPLAQTVRTGYHLSIFERAMRRNEGIAVGNRDMGWYSAHRNVRWVWTENPQGELQSYVGIGRGIDLTGIIHEWGGDAQGVRQILTQLAEANPALELLTSESMLKVWGMSIGGQKPAGEYLCMLKTFDEKTAARLKNADLWVWGLDAG